MVFNFIKVKFAAVSLYTKYALDRSSPRLGKDGEESECKFCLAPALFLALALCPSRNFDL